VLVSLRAPAPRQGALLPLSDTDGLEVPQVRAVGHHGNKDRALDKSVAGVWKTFRGSKSITASLAVKIAFDMGPVHKQFVTNAATSAHIFRLAGGGEGEPIAP